MARISNVILAIFNIITLLAGLAAVGLGLYLMLSPTVTVTPCQRGLRDPLMLTGVALFVVSFLGLVGSCCRVNLVLILYLVIMFLVIVGLIGFTIFAFLVTNVSVGKVFSKTKATDFQGKLWGNFVGGKNWEEMSNCLVDYKFCKDGNQKNWAPFQLGCCQPPTSCGFESQNATFWVAPKTGQASNDTDCTKWSNQQETLCYNCESCKAGIVANIKQEWKLITITNVCALIFCILVYTIGCCAKSNNRKDRKYKQIRGHQYA